MPPALLVENLSKQYKIGRAQQRHDTLRDALVDSLKAPFFRFRNSKFLFRNSQSQFLNSKFQIPNSSDTIWALKDVSFEVQPGEVLGIIGRNGAGKSTLLKILSRITEPTTGRAVINGRVGSLLEVGTGFHPELTGRENIYLNGAILGMTRKEIDRKFDEIVDFAEIEKFLDTPVKRYSSGMYVRLAFSVAAHLEPEILLIDEVLAVGDALFQKKSLGKMGDMAQGGRTVLFVSHNMAAIQGLCSRGILIDQGRISFSGTSRMVVENYLKPPRIDNQNAIPGIIELENRSNSYYPNKLFITRILLLDHEDHPNNSFLMGYPMKILIDVQDISIIQGTSVGILFLNKYEERITSINSEWTECKIESPRTRKERAILLINKLPLTPGMYYVSIIIFQHQTGRLDYVDKAVEINVIESDVYGTGKQLTGQSGYFYLDGSWEITNN